MKRSPSPAAPVIKDLANELLRKKGKFSIPEFKVFVSEKGYEFSQGQFAGALNSLLDQTGVYSPKRGVYAINSANKNSIISANLQKRDDSISSQINNVLDQTLKSLHEIGNINLAELNENHLTESEKLKKIIKGIETLKL